MTIRDVVDTGVAILAIVRENRVTVLAAGLAYYAFNSLIPATILLFIGVAAFEQFATLASVIGSVTGVDPLQLNEAFQTVTSNRGGLLRAAVIAAIIFVWSTARMFQAIQRTFSAVYGTSRPTSRLSTLVNVGVAFGTVVLALVLIWVIGVVMPFRVSGFVWAVLSPVLLFLTLFVVFVPMYYLFPPVDVTLREALPGAVFAATAWALSGVAFRLYASTSQSVQLYGVVGGVLLLLTWIYLGGLVLLVGVSLNALLADRVEIPAGGAS